MIKPKNSTTRTIPVWPIWHGPYQINHTIWSTWYGFIGSKSRQSMKDSPKIISIQMDCSKCLFPDSGLILFANKNITFFQNLRNGNLKCKYWRWKHKYAYRHRNVVKLMKTQQKMPEWNVSIHEIDLSEGFFPSVRN